jgi:hypothetical protein
VEKIKRGPKTMSDSIFEDNGTFGTRKIGPDQYEMHIPIPTEDGLVGRECPNSECSPGYFKVKLGTGITEGQVLAYCPYCRQEGEPSDFTTQAQIDYALGVLKNEVVKGIDKSIQKALGLGSSHKKTYGSGMFKMEMSYKPSMPDYVPRPLEEELRRDIICPNCGLEHAVFGLATWCPDCGKDIFICHVDTEFEVIQKVLSVIDKRREELGARVAGRDIENGLEDTVSVFEAVLKIITKKRLADVGISPDEIIKRLEKIRNSYQNINSAGKTFCTQTGLELFDGVSKDEVETLKTIFEKRHPITHNLGVVDKKYLERVRTGETEGREIRVTAQEVERAIQISRRIISSTYELNNQ